jgi:hypothetical protein
MKVEELEIMLEAMNEMATFIGKYHKVIPVYLLRTLFVSGVQTCNQMIESGSEIEEEEES